MELCEQVQASRSRRCFDTHTHTLMQGACLGPALGSQASPEPSVLMRNSHTRAGYVSASFAEVVGTMVPAQVTLG